MEKPELGWEVESKTIRSGIIETIAERSMTFVILAVCTIAGLVYFVPGLWAILASLI